MTWIVLKALLNHNQPTSRYLKTPKNLQLGSQNLTQKYSMSPGKLFILGSKGQGHEAQKYCQHGFCFCTVLSADFLWLLNVEVLTCALYILSTIHTCIHFAIDVRFLFSLLLFKFIIYVTVKWSVSPWSHNFVSTVELYSFSFDYTTLEFCSIFMWWLICQYVTVLSHFSNNCWPMCVYHCAQLWHTIQLTSRFLIGPFGPRLTSLLSHCVLCSPSLRLRATLWSAAAPRMSAAVACAKLTPLASPAQCDQRTPYGNK